MTSAMNTEAKLTLAIASLKEIAGMPTESECDDMDDFCLGNDEALDAMNEAISQARHALSLLGA